MLGLGTRTTNKIGSVLRYFMSLFIVGNCPRGSSDELLA